jgi:phage baseplate assembly protein W
MPSIQKFYKGFSTRNYEENGGSFALYNVECVQEDLMNAIFTERGSRLYMPTYGTRIPTLTFEPNDAATMDVIREDITTVMDNDPRVILQDLVIEQIPDSYALIAVAKITYVEFNVTSDLYITINSR